VSFHQYFKRVKISPSAATKMMMHAQSGVDKGVAQGSNPIEVMGLLMGRIDIDDLNCLIIHDACPIPAEGFETRFDLQNCYFLCLYILNNTL